MAVVNSKKAKENAGNKGPVFMCMVCGFMSQKVLPVKCPECGATRENFRKVNEQ